MKDSTSSPGGSGPVAVIAVHGVADQSKDETAVTAANLLLYADNLGEDGEDCSKAHYAGFEQEKIRVAVEPLDVSGMGDETSWQSQLRDHLIDYSGEGTKGSYETVRMEGHRYTKTSNNAAPKLDRGVHVYEMHWADVSRLKIGFLNILVALYRLLFEASWLGQQTIGPWASSAKDVGRFSYFTSFRGLMLLLHTIARVILTRFMLPIYLIMIAMLTLTAIPVVETDWAQRMLGGLGGYAGLLALFTVAIVAVVLVLTASHFWQSIPWPPVFVLVAILSFFAWIFVFAALQIEGEFGTWWAESGVALVLWGVICLLIYFLLVPALNNRYPGSRLVVCLLLTYFTAGLILGLMRETEWPLAMSASLFALRLGFALIPILWIILATSANLFFVLAVIELISLRLRPWKDKEVLRRKRARLHTAMISLALPVLLISFFNSTFFLLALFPVKSGLVDGAVPIPGRTGDAPAQIATVANFVEAHIEPFADRFANLPNFRRWTEENHGQDAVFSEYVNSASAKMVIPFLEAIFMVVLLVLGYSAWTLAPAALAESARWTTKDDPDRWDSVSQSLGKNLSRGYSWLWAGQVVLIGCLFATQVLFVYRSIRSKADLEVETRPFAVLFDQFLGLTSFTESVDDLEIVAATANIPDSGGVAAAAEGRIELPEPVASPSPRPEPTRRIERIQPVNPRQSPIQSQVQQAAPIQQQRIDALAYPEQKLYLKRAKIGNIERQETRERIEEILQQHEEEIQKKKGSPTKGDAPNDRPPNAAPGANDAPDAPAADELGMAEKLKVKTLTEFVLFLNSGPLTSAFGVTVLILALGYLFFSRIVDPVISSLRGGLDIALDVVNYLRPVPRDGTFRARILSRFASLLKYVVDWRDPQNPEVRYSRIVILAHSQGTVISSDILRALSKGSVAQDNGLEVLRRDPDSNDWIPIRLYTMGSPLRQLYAARFPDLFAWNSSEDPRTHHRGLEAWWNAYRSGDYVGRMLFRDLKDPDAFVPERDFIMSQNGRNIPVRETCIGPGAHTHYWDETAPSVIRGLDYLIACDDAEDLGKPRESMGTDSKDGDDAIVP